MIRLHTLPKYIALFIIMVLMGTAARAQVNVGPIPTLPKGKSIRIVYDAQINSPLVPASTTQVSHQGTVSGGNFSAVSTNTVITPLDVPPFVVSITRKTPVTATAINNTSVTYLVTFSEAVSGVDASDFELTKTGSADGTVAPVPAGPAAAYDVTVNSVTGDGTLRLDLKGSGTDIVDEGNTAITGGFTTGELYTFDHTVPTLNPVTIASGNANPAYAKVGDKVTLSFTSSETIATPTATILGKAATVSKGSGNQWKAEYALLSGDAPEGLIAFAISFSDEAGNAGTSVTATTNGSSVTFDKTAPSATINQAAGQSDPTSSTTIHFTTVFDEPVSGFTSADITLGGTAGATTAVATEVAPQDGTTYDVAVSGMTTDGTVLASIAAGRATDQAGNLSVTAASIDNTVAYVQNVSPSVVSINRHSPAAALTNATSVTFRITFSEEVTGVDASDFTSFSPSDLVTGTIGAVSGSGATYDVAVEGISGDGSLRLDLKSSGTGIEDGLDAAITGGFTTGETYTVDRTAPEVVMMARGTPDDQYTNATSVIYKVYFSEAVTGVDASDFYLYLDPGLGGTIGTVTGSGAEYSVQVNTITGDGSMFPNVYTSGTDIADAANNHLSGGFNNSMGYIFDHTAPSVQSINRFDPSAEATTATTLVYRVAFSEPVSGVDKSDFALAATSPSTGTIASLAVVPGSWEREYDVTVHVTNGGGGTLRLDLNSSHTGIADEVGNAVSGGFTDGQSYTLGVPPSFVNFPGDATLNADAGKCSAAKSFSFSTTGTPAPTVVAKIGATAISFPYNFPVGSTTVTVTASNGILPDATRTFTVTVQDNQDPTITAPPAIAAQPIDANLCGAAKGNVNLGTPATDDNCAVASLTNDAPAVFPVGITLVTWTVTDVHGRTNTATQSVTVVDTQKPSISPITQNVFVLAPPNHKMRDVTLNYAVSDNCSSGLTYSVSVTSNEPTNGTGDGDTDTDWEVVSNYLVRLRAERAAQGSGRIYTITVTARDASGNETVRTAQVVVAHNIVSPLSGHAVKVGSTVSFSGTFWDKPANRHTASWSLDGTTSVKGTVVEPSGLKNGTVTGSYKFTAPGIYKLQLNVKDQSGVTTWVNSAGDLEAIVVVYDPNGGYTMGGGWFTSAPGALTAAPWASGKVSYGFQSNYYKGATYPKGETQLEFKVGNLEFNALNFEYLSVARGKAQFKGSGKMIGDQSGYGFMLTVMDGAIAGGADRIRMKIFNKNTGRVIYDNQPGASDAADPLTAVGSGSTIVISGGSVATARTDAQGPTVQPEAAGGLTITAAPNPAPHYFTLTVASDQYREAIILQIYDVYGRVVDTRSVTQRTTLQVGQDYKHGAYYARVVQGRKQKEIKLIKLNN